MVFCLICFVFYNSEVLVYAFFSVQLDSYGGVFALPIFCFELVQFVLGFGITIFSLGLLHF